MNVVIDLQQVSLIPPVVDFAVPPRVEEDDGKEEHNHHYNDTDQTEHPLLTTPGRGRHYKECCLHQLLSKLKYELLYTTLHAGR